VVSLLPQIGELIKNYGGPSPIQFDRSSLNYLFSFYIEKASQCIEHGAPIINKFFADTAFWLQIGRNDLTAQWISRFIHGNASIPSNEYRVGDLYEYSFKYFMDSLSIEYEKRVSMMKFAKRLKEMFGTISGVEIHNWNGHTVYTGFYLNDPYYYERVKKRINGTEYHAVQEEMDFDYREQQREKHLPACTPNAVSPGYGGWQGAPLLNQSGQQPVPNSMHPSFSSTPNTKSGSLFEWIQDDDPSDIAESEIKSSQEQNIYSDGEIPF
jgi:hypothetical protein